MLHIFCPHCGELRSEEEFHAGGQAHIARPLDPNACTDEEWGEYLFFRDNPRGIHHELWIHAAGCFRKGTWYSFDRQVGRTGYRFVVLDNGYAGAIAEELASGGSLEEGEREVSVLFVDVRGYTSFAERRAAPEIFDSVNRYTRTVSDVVLRHGGVVVEFNGDGMMAVFGAPRPLPRKEEAALRAARDLAAEVGALEIEGTRLSVGVGVASGPAFVGSVRAIDRNIWSALGNTTNLAARLEKLTRDLDVQVAVDAATWTAAGPFGEGFEARPAQRIRGRTEPVDVYVLAFSRT